MAYTTIKKSTDYFNTVLYSGNNSTQSITGVGHQPDLIWVKARNDTANNTLTDVIRGTNSVLYTNQTQAQDTPNNAITSFDSDGFSLGNNGSFNASSINYASWNWKANGAGSSNTDGSITSTVSANTTSGFSIVSYTGTGANATIGHGLGSTPAMIIVKKTSVAGSWYVYHQSLGNTKRLVLDTTSASTTDANAWNNTSPTSSVFSVGASGTTNASGATHIGYCFAEKKGFSKFGSYTGNGNADGTFVYTGFKPAWIMLKNTTDNGDNWTIYDNKRDIDNPASKLLFAQDNGVEGDGNNMDILSNGFKQRNTSNGNNGSGDTFIYMAFAEEPLVGDNPATAR